jgi:hypothetical protein
MTAPHSSKNALLDTRNAANPIQNPTKARQFGDKS